MTARPEALTEGEHRLAEERGPTMDQTARPDNVVPIRPGISRRPDRPVKEISNVRDETRGRLVQMADLTTIRLPGYREPQLVEKARPLYPVHVITGEIRHMLGRVRIISTAPPDLSAIYPDKDTAEMAEFADWGD